MRLKQELPERKCLQTLFTKLYFIIVLPKEIPDCTTKWNQKLSLNSDFYVSVVFPEQTFCSI